MKITLTKATAALWRQATLNPDRENPVNQNGGCEYFKNGQRCLIGQVIFDLTGVSMMSPSPAKGYIDFIDKEGTLAQLKAIGVEISEPALALLKEAQILADGPNPHETVAWRRAVIEVMEA